MPEEIKDRDQMFKVSLSLRNKEIDLFWKRGLFFWGFIASAFIGFATLYKDNIGLSIIIACFGMICSFVLTLANRGSKYWQENWEQKAHRIADEILGKYFSKEEEVMKKGMWLQARRYSVSKLAIALSDYLFGIWTIIVICQLVCLISDKQCVDCLRSIFKPIIIIASLIYLVFIACKCKTSLDNEEASEIKNEK